MIHSQGEQPVDFYSSFAFVYHSYPREEEDLSVRTSMAYLKPVTAGARPSDNRRSGGDGEESQGKRWADSVFWAPLGISDLVVLPHLWKPITARRYLFTWAGSLHTAHRCGISALPIRRWSLLHFMPCGPIPQCCRPFIRLSGFKWDVSQISDPHQTISSRVSCAKSSHRALWTALDSNCCR